MVVVFACLLAKTISMLTCRHTRSSFVPTCRLCYPSYAVRHLPFLYTLWLYTRRDIWRVGRRQHTSRGRVDAERAPNESAYGETCAWHIESNRRSRDELLWEINFWPSEVWKTLNRTHVYGARALVRHEFILTRVTQFIHRLKSKKKNCAAGKSGNFRLWPESGVLLIHTK